MYEHKITQMAKIYSDYTPKKIQLNPKKETVDFLLNYSKALRVNYYKSLEFVTLLN